jgi:starch phosphorylase
MNPQRYLPRPLPEPLEGLVALALDLRWSWSYEADDLWRAIDGSVWEATRNPWLILERLSRARLEALAQDAGIVQELERLVDRREQYLRKPSCWDQTVGPEGPRAIAYFSMEFGLNEALPLYSDGLGVLAGDHLKTASDLGAPVVGVGLLYQQGYFRQALDARGDQIVYYPYNAASMLPLVPLRSADGEWTHVPVELPGRTVKLRAWQVQVGRGRLFLLDSNHPLAARAVAQRRWSQSQRLSRYRVRSDQVTPSRARSARQLGRPTQEPRDGSLMSRLRLDVSSTSTEAGTGAWRSSSSRTSPSCRLSRPRA